MVFSALFDIFVTPASGMARYSDPVFRPIVRPSVCRLVHPSVNICDYPSVDFTFRSATLKPLLHNSEIL